MKRSPAENYGRLHLTPVAVVAGAFRRAWVRVVELGRRDRAALQRVIEYTGDLDCLLAQHDVRHAKHVDSSRRVFRAPDLVYCPPAPRQPSRASRAAAVPIATGSRARHFTR